MPQMNASYKPVRDAMAAGTPHELICGTCPWDRLCVRPPDMTEQEVIARVEEIRQEVRRTGGDRTQITAMVTAVAIYGGRDTAGAMCPVFVARLRSPDGRQLADSIRTLMRGERA